MDEKGRIYWLPIAIVLAFVAVAIFGVITFRNTFRVREVEQRVAKSYAVREATHELLSAIKDMETGERGYLLTGNERYLDPYHAGIQDAERGFTRLKKLVVDNSMQLEQLAQMRELIDERRKQLDHTIALRSENPEVKVSDEVLSIVKSDGGKQTMDEVRRVANVILTREGQLLSDREAISEQHASVSRTSITVGHLLALGFIVFVGIAAHVDRKKRGAAEQSLAARQSELAAVIDAASDGIVLVDMDDQIVSWNEGARRLYGITKSEAIGKDAAQIPTSQSSGTVGRRKSHCPANG